MMIQLLLAAAFTVITQPGVDDDVKLPERYRKWIEEEVVYIISEDERDIFYKLENNKQRDRFIEEFWEQRDPSPGTEKNEFKEEHYRRIDYANKWLGRETAKPGWRTDRGKIYIQLGEPKQKRSYDGHQKLQPLEMWFYQADVRLGVPPFFYVIFFKRFGVGEYILYDPALHGPEGLIFLNAGQAPEQAPMLIADFDTELAMASINLVPTETSDIEMYRGRPSLSSVQLMAQLENIPNYRRDATYADRILRGQPKIETMYAFDSSGLPTDLSIIKMPNGIPLLNYAFHYSTRKLELGQYEDTVYGALEIVLTVMTPDEKPVINKTIQLDEEFDDTEQNRLKQGGFTYEGTQVILPGSYEATLTVRNKVSKVFYSYTESIDVPFSRTTELQVMPPVLYPMSQTGSAFDPSSIPPYKYATLKMYPLLYDELRRGQDIGVFYQINVPLVNGALPEQPMEVRYRVVDENDEVFSDDSVWIGKNQYDNLGTASVLWRLETENLKTNIDYHIEFIATLGEQISRVNSQTFSVNDSVTIAPPFTRYGPFVSFADNNYLIEQAEQLIALERYETAAKLLENPSKLNLSDEKLNTVYAEALVGMGDKNKAIDVLLEMTLRYPEKVDIRRQLATLYLQTGKYNKAIGHLEQVRLTEGDSVEVLNPLGEAYFRANKPEKAREIWELSLMIESEQPQIKARLDQ